MIFLESLNNQDFESLDNSKTDFELGRQIHSFLVQKKIETPFLKNGNLEFQDMNNLDRFEIYQDKMKKLEKLFSDFLNIFNLDLSNDSLKDTPMRVAKMFLLEFFTGLNYINFPKITTIENNLNYDEIILEKKIKVHSFCEHHLVPIVGYASIAYIPNKKIIGLSKLNRIVDFFCKRPQVQERLTEQIFYTLNYILDTENIAVHISADHFCVKLRGIKDINSVTSTSKMGGVFRDSISARNEFFQMLALENK